MSLRNTRKLLRSLVKEEETTNLRRSARARRSLVDTNASSEGESGEELPTKKTTRSSYKKRKLLLAAKQEQKLSATTLVNAGHDMPPGETRDRIPAVELPSLPEQEKPMGHELLHGETRDGIPAVEVPSLPEQETSMGRVVPPGEMRDGVPAVKLPSLPEQEKSMGHELPPGEIGDGVPVVDLPSLLEQENLMGNEMPLGETRAGGPIVEIPSSPEEEKTNIDLHFLKTARKPPSQKDDSLELREHLLNAASILKFKLVTRLKSSADSLKTMDMIILANRCFNALIELEDDYTSFHSEVKKLIAQQQEVEFAAKDKGRWNDCDIEARYMQQVKCLSCVEERLSSAQDKLTTAEAKVDALKVKLYEEEERVKTLTAERDELQKSQYDIKVGIENLDTEKAEASVALKAINAKYNAAKGEFETTSNRLLQLVKYRVSPRPISTGVSTGIRLMDQ